MVVNLLLSATNFQVPCAEGSPISARSSASHCLLLLFEIPKYSLESLQYSSLTILLFHAALHALCRTQLLMHLSPSRVSRSMESGRKRFCSKPLRFTSPSSDETLADLRDKMVKPFRLPYRTEFEARREKGEVCVCVRGRLGMECLWAPVPCQWLDCVGP